MRLETFHSRPPCAAHCGLQRARTPHGVVHFSKFRLLARYAVGAHSYGAPFGSQSHFHINVTRALLTCVQCLRLAVRCVRCATRGAECGVVLISVLISVSEREAIGSRRIDGTVHVLDAGRVLVPSTRPTVVHIRLTTIHNGNNPRVPTRNVHRRRPHRLQLLDGVLALGLNYRRAPACSSLGSRAVHSLACA